MKKQFYTYDIETCGYYRDNKARCIISECIDKIQKSTGIPAHLLTSNPDTIPEEDERVILLSL
jgi:hypothetical protein